MASTKNGIIYPDNYDKVADVPADLKEMAESVDENIEQINEKIKQNSNNIESLQADNTTNKKSIEELKQKNAKQDESIKTNASEIEELKQENIEIKAENKRLRSDIESISLLGEAEGESIDLEDSSEARFNKFEIGGNHSQETREGYNLLENKSTTQTKNGVTITKNTDETLVVNGTATSDFTFLIASNIVLENGKKYRLSGCPAGGADKKYALTMNQYYENQSHYTQDYGSGSLFTYNELSANTNSVYIRVIKDVTYNNLIFKPMIIAGENEKEYEQYGATPSLDFTSEIKTVKDNANVVVCNKNILKILDLGKRWEYTEKGIKNLYANPGIKISQLNLKKGQTVEIGFLLLSKVNNDISFVNFVNDKTGVIASFANIQNYNVNTVYKKKYTATDDCTIKTVLYGNVNEEIFEFQLWAEYNQISSTYIKHQEQTITIPVQQEMLEGDSFDWDNEEEDHEWIKIVLDGTQNLIQQSTNIENKYRYAFNVIENLNKEIKSSSVLENKAYSDSLKLLNKEETNSCIEGFTTISNVLWIYTDGSSLEEFKTKLSNKPITFYIPLVKTDKLPFTEEQKAVAKKIKEILHTYKNITRIYSTDEISPIVNVEYAKDLNTQNNNLQNQIDEIKQLISTTQTSAMLLDNLQKEVESEVE